jgi:hypothetical protein
MNKKKIEKYLTRRRSEIEYQVSIFLMFIFLSLQVEEVIGIMHKNVENVLDRDRKLGDLEERADALQDGCAQFEKQV